MVNRIEGEVVWLGKRVAWLDRPNVDGELMDYLTRDEIRELRMVRDRMLESKSELGYLKKCSDISVVEARLFDVLRSIESDYVRVMELRRAAERRKGIVEKVINCVV